MQSQTMVFSLCVLKIKPATCIINVLYPCHCWSHAPTSLWALISSVSFLGSHMNPVISPCVPEINYLVRLNQPVEALLCYCMNCICMYDNLLWCLHFPISLHLSVITEISSSMPSRAIRRHYCMIIPRCKTLYDSKWNVSFSPLGLSYVSIW